MGAFGYTGLVRESREGGGEGGGGRGGRSKAATVSPAV